MEECAAECKALNEYFPCHFYYMLNKNCILGYWNPFDSLSNKENQTFSENILEVYFLKNSANLQGECYK